MEDIMQTEPPSFHKFAELPYEIRLLIWTQFLPSPRIIHIFERRLKSTQRQLYFEMLPRVAIDTDTPPPTELFACREAYSLLADWGPRFSCSTEIPPTIPQTYFHPRDTLYLSRVSQPPLSRPDAQFTTLTCSAALISPVPLLRKIMAGGQLSCVKNLAVDLYVWNSARSQDDGLKAFLVLILGFFPCLKRLTLVYEHIEPSLSRPESSAFASLRDFTCRDDLVFLDQSVVTTAIRYDESLGLHFSSDAPHLGISDNMEWWGKIKDINWLADLKKNHEKAAERGYAVKMGQEGFFSVTGPNYPKYLQGYFTDDFRPGVTHELPSIKWKYAVTREHGAMLEAACAQQRKVFRDIDRD